MTVYKLFALTEYRQNGRKDKVFIVKSKLLFDLFPAP